MERVRENPRAHVLIVGGGINGLSTLRELALQGVEVTLVEKKITAPALRLRPPT